MARRFTKVLEEEIEEAFFYPSDLVNTKTTIPLRVGEERWIYTSTLRVSVYIHHYSPPLRGIVVYYYHCCTVISNEADNGVITKTIRVQSTKQISNQTVHIASCSIITLPDFLGIPFWHITIWKA